jgi:undecaprenyl-diphosphatase
MTKSILDQGVTITFNIMPMSVGFLAALVSGVLACTWMIALVKHSKLSYFAVYCLVVGITTYVFS